MLVSSELRRCVTANNADEGLRKAIRFCAGVSFASKGMKVEARDVGRAHQGTLEALYRDYHGFVCRSLLRMAVPSRALEDAVHDTFMVAARRLQEFEGRASLRSWLFAIAVRVAQAERRDRARAQRKEERLRNTAAQRTTLDPTPRHEAASELQALMAELEGKTAPEIADELGVKLATVYSRLRLARQKLEALVRTRSAPRVVTNPAG